jgi:thiamine biosynthesis lipoprotein
MKKPLILDFGAAGKGYLIDIVGQILTDAAFPSFSINAGGDILISNSDERIGLENPLDTTQAIGVVSLHSGSICGSSGNRRTWGNFHHIMDPTTLASPENILATWVTAQTAMYADGLATCLFLSEPELLTHHFSFEYVILYQDFSIKKSSNFPAELFIS